VLDWLNRGLVAGIRIDHPDGLADPTAYFQHLRKLAPKAWIVAEKVLEPGHALPAGWPVNGTTGYEFMNLSFGLFVDPRGVHALETAWQALTATPALSFSALASEAKREVLEELLAAELTRLTRVAELAVGSGDAELTPEPLRAALNELLVAMPHGRTHRSRCNAATVEERTQLRTALARAVEDRPDLASALSALESALSGPLESDAAWQLCQRFQQLTAAVSAKGVEDTAFYRFGPLIALCDLGSNPELATFSPEDFHAHCQQVASERPLTMNTTSTHDTKRGEDARLRIGVLSEMPAAFAAAVTRWRRLLQPTPLLDPQMDYHLFQTLVGVWPISRARMMQYALKAAREMKRFTSWVRRNHSYETTLRAFLERLYECPEFTADLEHFLVPVYALAATYSLAQLLLKLTAPGVPDIYQGSELWELHLVDPDNRRAVDFAARHRALGELSNSKASDFVLGDERAKLWLMQRALQRRASLPKVFGPLGTYRGLETHGALAEHIVAFARGERVLTIVPRLVACVQAGWLDTRVSLPAGVWQSDLTGQRWSRRELACSELFREFPVALLTREE
jgi:(1->4)-alpha-D-glucan 1-alpha-D-glucosylmutase